MAVKKDLYILLLLALIAFKVSSVAIHNHLHHSHDDEHEDNCELCEHALYHQNVEFFAPADFPSIRVDNAPHFHQQKDSYKSVCVAPVFNKTLFGRPPPLLA